MSAPHLLPDTEIDRIALDQDGGEWLTKQLTKLEWRAFARDVERAAVSMAKGRAFDIADAQMRAAFTSFMWPVADGHRIPERGGYGHTEAKAACEWLVLRALVDHADGVFRLKVL
jgi:hypothetical protein